MLAIYTHKIIDVPLWPLAIYIIWSMESIIDHCFQKPILSETETIVLLNTSLFIWKMKNLSIENYWNFNISNKKKKNSRIINRITYM